MKLARWARIEELSSDDSCFVKDSETLPHSLARLTVVTASGSEARATELLERGAERVLLGDLALLDSAAVTRLAERHGADRIGVWVPATKGSISWALADEAPNAGFKCMMPSMGVPGWEVMKSDQTSTGTDAEWWVRQMLEMGASMALISIDMQDDDLNICAGMIEEHGEKLWFSPLHVPNADLEPWVRYGHVRQLVLPTPNERDEHEMARICAPAATAVEAANGESDGGEENSIAA